MAVGEIGRPMGARLTRLVFKPLNDELNNGFSSQLIPAWGGYLPIYSLNSWKEEGLYVFNVLIIHKMQDYWNQRKESIPCRHQLFLWKK